MANNTNYEPISVGHDRAVAPRTSVIVGAKCAIFYVDPDSDGIVRYRGDQTDPTGTTGIPLRPGKSITIAGEGNIRNARFITEDRNALIHAMYYDQVDVVDLGLSGDPTGTDLVGEMHGVTDKLEEIGYILRQVRNAVGYMAFGKMGDDIPIDDR